MKLQKWDSKEHKYNDYYVPYNKNVKCYSDNMEEIVNCCQCLKEMKYGDGYTSLEVHTLVGFGCCVCYDCYQEEWKRRRENV